MAKKPAAKEAKPFDPVLNIKNEMTNADRRNFRFYQDLNEDQKKKMGGLYPIMRWMSILQRNDPGFSEFYITTVNDIANVGFWDLSNHIDLQWKLIAACGVGTPMSHGWIAAPRRTSTNKLDKLILEVSPSLNNQELYLVKSKLTKDSLGRLCRDLGWLDSEIKPYLDELKKFQEKNNIEST